VRGLGLCQILNQNQRRHHNSKNNTMPTNRESEGERAAKSKVRAYLAALPPDSRRILKKIRETIIGAAPGATEQFSYGIPGFRFNGKPLMWYAGWKEHVGMYPMTATIKRANAAGLKGYEVSKGTVRFPLTKPPSKALVTRLVKARIAEIRKQSKE
jgi:uncharacterized protein YdhG (YjbR/CyaY superfamily)